MQKADIQKPLVAFLDILLSCLSVLFIEICQRYRVLVSATSLPQSMHEESHIYGFTEISPKRKTHPLKNFL